MDSSTEEIYFQKLQEFIQDDDKIVTVSSLASKLGISVQTSQTLISKYVGDQRKLKPEELAVTYVLTGTLKDDKGKAVFMVREQDLENKRGLFGNVPHEVIYSVQKCKRVDFNVIALVDAVDSTNIREKALAGSIVSKNCVRRVMKFKKLPSPPPATLKGKSAFFAPKTEKSEATNKPLESPKSESKSKPSGGISDLFKAAASKPSQKDSVKSSVSKPGKPADKKSGGLVGFLSNGSFNSSKSHSGGDVKNENVVKTRSDAESQEVKEDVMAVDVSSDEGVKIVNEVKKEPAKKEKQDKKKKKRLRDRSQETSVKRRKRIIERNDSDSDDLFENAEDREDILEKSDDEPERVPSPVAQKQLAPKNKRRKAIDRNFEDEEGFIVTKTEYVYVTASEDENEEPNPPKKEKQQKVEKPKPKAPEKKKAVKNQATLMSFFKKV